MRELEFQATDVVPYCAEGPVSGPPFLLLHGWLLLIHTQKSWHSTGHCSCFKSASVPNNILARGSSHTSTLDRLSCLTFQLCEPTMKYAKRDTRIRPVC